MMNFARSRYFFWFVCVGIALNVLSTAFADNLLKNGGFSQVDPAGKAVGWELGNWARGGQQEVDQTVFQSEPASLKITQTDPEQYTLAIQRVAVKPNTKYRVSFWMKGEQIAKGSGGIGAQLFIDDVATGKSIVGGTFKGVSQGAVGTFDWTKAEIEFSSGSTTEIHLYLYLHHAAGTVWYDDVSLEEVPPELPKPISGEVFPSDLQKNTYHFIEDFPQVWVFKFKGDAQLAKDARLVIDVPAKWECLGACPWLSTQVVDGIGSWKPEPMVAKSVERDGKPYTQYEISLNSSLIRSLKPDKFEWGQRERVYLRALPGSVEQSGIIYWRIDACDFRDEEKQVQVTVLPQLPQARAKTKRFNVVISSLGQETAPFAGVPEAYRNFWKSLQQKPYTFQPYGWQLLSSEARNEVARNFRMLLLEGSDKVTPANWCFSGWYANARKSDKTLEIPFVVTFDGKRIENSICPSYMAGDPKGLVANDYIPSVIKTHLKDMPQNEGIIWDFEPGAMDYCFCGQCIDNFTAFAKLAQKPTAAEIRGKYEKEWFDFRVGQHGKIVENFSMAVKKHFPGVPFWICTDPLHANGETLAKWCGVDERINSHYVDGHMSMPYYSGARFFKDVKLNVETLKKPVFPLLDPTEDIASFYSQYTPESVKQNILAAAANGCVGIGFWPMDNFDGKYLAEIADGFHLVARAEDYYFGDRNNSWVSVVPPASSERTFSDEGKTIKAITSSFGDDIQYTAHQHGGNYLVTVFNFNDTTDVMVSVRMKEFQEKPRFRVCELTTGKLFVNENGKPLGRKEIKNGFLALVPKHGVVLLEISKENLESAPNGTVSQASFLKALDNRSNSSDNEKLFQEIKKGGAGIGWGDINQDGTMEVKLELSGRKIYIDPRGGRIIGWKKEAVEGSDLLSFKNRGFLDDLIMYDDTAGKGGYVFTLQSRDVIDGVPEAVFTHLFKKTDGANPEEYPFEGLSVTKRITLLDQGRTVKCAYCFTNNNPLKRRMTLGFRVKNEPRLGDACAGMKSLAQISSIAYQTPSGENLISSATTGENHLMLRAGVVGLEFWKKLTTPVHWIPSSIAVRAEGCDEMLAFEPDAEATAGFYVWWPKTGSYSIELLSSEKSLEYGASLRFEYLIKQTHVGDVKQN